MMCAVSTLPDWHKIGNFCDPIVREQARDENISFWDIKLFMLDTGGSCLGRCNTEKAALVSIEQCTKGTG